MKNLKITLFAGGSGNSRLINIISKIKNIDIKIIVNCYDDGKSTGRLRDLINGMLGPSDIRKNLSSLLDNNDSYEKKLRFINDYRFKKIKLKNFVKLISKEHIELNNIISSLPKKINEDILNYLKIFQKKINKKIIEKDFSLGNAIFSGIFLEIKNFNKSIEIYTKLFNKEKKIYNVSDGENLFLCAIRKDGQILKNEEEIVSKSGKLIDDIYLLKKKFNYYHLKKFSHLNLKTKKQELKKMNSIPKINIFLKNILKNSDIILYGPGTIHSSLLPTYLTKNLSDCIASSNALKILISNIGKDKDMLFEDTDNIIKKTYYYLKLKNTKKINQLKLIDLFFINKIDRDDLNNKFLNRYLELKSYPKKNVKYIDWEEEKGKHNPVTLLKEILLSYDKKYVELLNDYSNISIIVPCLNERKTIRKVCDNLENIKIYFKGLLLSKEIIVVDSSSSDNTDKILKKRDKIKYYQIKNLGRGNAIRYGISKAKGEVVVIFPADNEYNTNEIQKIIEPILSKHTDITFGSRAIKCTNLSKQISKIYKKNYFGYFTSKYGGMLLSIICLLLFNRYISDPLTTFKAFKKSTLNNLKLKSNGVNLEVEMIAKISKTEKYILEIPVNYLPRTKDSGKKITILDGINCILSILKLRLFN